MRMICPKCRHENPDDAVICEFCGETLRLQKPPETLKDRDDEGGFTMRNVKILGIGIFILFIVTVALLWPGTHGTITDNDSYLSGHASWQQIAIYNGTSDDLRSFQIKGSKMKVYITAQPLTPDTNLKCEIYGSNVVASSDDLAWKGNDTYMKTMSLQIKSQPGSYSVNIDIPDIPVNQVKWTVQVFDYY
jgi:ribosomal protein L40E